MLIADMMEKLKQKFIRKKFFAKESAKSAFLAFTYKLF